MSRSTPAGAGGGALPVVPDQQHPPAPVQDEPDRRCPGSRVDANPASSTITRVPLVDGRRPSPADRVRVVVGAVRRRVCPGCRWPPRAARRGVPRRREACGANPRTVPPAFCQAAGEDPHHGGLPGAGRRQRQVDPAAAGGDLPDHRLLRGVQGAAAGVGRPFQHRDLHIARRRPGGASVSPAAATIRRSASITEREVYSWAFATRNTEVPSPRRSPSGTPGPSAPVGVVAAAPRCRTDRGRAQHPGGDPGGDRVDRPGRDAGGPDLPGGLGQHVVLPPLRPGAARARPGSRRSSSHDQLLADRCAA